MFDWTSHQHLPLLWVTHMKCAGHMQHPCLPQLVSMERGAWKWGDKRNSYPPSLTLLLTQLPLMLYTGVQGQPQPHCVPHLWHQGPVPHRNVLWQSPAPNLHDTVRPGTSLL